MWRRYVGAVIVVSLSVAMVKADISRSSSRVFSFPAFTAVQQGMLVAHPGYFRFLQNTAGARVVTLTWSLPAQSKTLRGAITVYSLRGQAIKVFPITSTSGMVKWNAAREGAAGLYIARLVYGPIRQNIRMMLCN